MTATTVTSYRDLGAWKQTMALAAKCYRATKPFPRDELYGMSSQIRRAATSIPANIAEGNGRETTAAYINFLRISQGSLKELGTLLLLANSVGLLDKSTCDSLVGECEDVGRPLRALIRSLQAKDKSDRLGE